MKKSIIVLGVATLCATGANALFIEDDWGDSVGAYGGDPSGGVTVIGKREVGAMSPGGWWTVTAPTPLARPPGGDAGGGGIPPRQPPTSEEERRKRRDQCLNDCSVSYQVTSNLCAQNVADLRYELSVRPYAAALAGAIAGAIATRNPIGALVGAPAAWTYTTAVNTNIVADYTAQCAGFAASDWNFCIQQVCNAWFLPLLLLTRRRKEDDA